MPVQEIASPINFSLLFIFKLLPILNVRCMNATSCLPFLMALRLSLVASPSLAQQPVAVLGDRFLIPESITWNQQTKEFYISSINRQKIVAIRKGGEGRDFIQSGQDGFLQGLGLHLDMKHHVLWAVSNRTTGHLHTSGIWMYDPQSARLLKKWVWSDTAALLLNDLAITRQGNIYVTDSEGSKVYYLKQSMDHPRLLLTMPKGDYPNGITLSDDDRYLFIATYMHGIVCYDRRKRRHWTLQAPKETSTNGMDGLFFYHNTLIGVDNNSDKPADHKITQFYLSDDWKTIARSKVIDEHNPYFDIPTSAVIAGDSLFVLANSQLEHLDQQNNTLKDTSVLKKTYILGYKLD